MPRETREGTEATDLRGGEAAGSGWAAPEILRVRGWERFPWLRAGFSARRGGKSSVYGPEEQNLGWTAEDDPALVAANRRRFVAALAERADLELVTIRQVHGAEVSDLEGEPRPWSTGEGRSNLEGDGLISRTPGRLLAVLTADCVPVLLADTRTHAVGALHAGWRGTLAGIAERGIAQMAERYGSRAEDLIAAIGPSIGVCCFAVGAEVETAFGERFRYGLELFIWDKGRGERRMDLVEANRRQLLEAGVPEGAVSVMGECTACCRGVEGGRRYFSYRAERGVTGRMLSGIASVA